MQILLILNRTKIDLEKYIEEHPFTFDTAFNEHSSNELIYLEALRPMIEAAFLTKAKITCFAYGQTGSGKTFTMMGSNQNINDCSSPGLYLFTAYDIFNILQHEQYASLLIYASFYEIYCGKLFDLLNERKVLPVREDGKQNICIVGLTQRQVTNLNELMLIIEHGLKARTVGVTGANADSSRSHGIIQISIKDCHGAQQGKITFIDLAGSERASETIDTNKQTRFDGGEINKSLLALKECIRALDQDKKHTPFRGSKLTMVLRDSFLGNCKTLMIANISPSSTSVEHTLNTLRYADRVKELRSKNDNPHIKTEPKYANKDPTEYLASLLNNNNQCSNKQLMMRNSISNGTSNQMNCDSFNSNVLQETKEDNNSVNNNDNTKNKDINKENINNTNMNFNNIIFTKQTINLRLIKPNNNRFKSIDDLERKHNEIKDILIKEEDCYIKAHKTHIDDMIEIINLEMNVVEEAQKDPSALGVYIKSMKEIYEEKLNKITEMKERMKHLEQLVNEETNLSYKLQCNHNQIQSNKTNGK